MPPPSDRGRWRSPGRDRRDFRPVYELRIRRPSLASRPAPRKGATVSAFFLSAGLIFIAELGDKSQLVALWFATRHRWWVVLAGVTAATLVVHLGSVALGRAIDEIMPIEIIRVIVGLSFFGFAWWSVRGDRIDEDRQREY